MITIKLYKKDNKYYGFESVGHADYDEKGRDIVCAAVSTLTYTLVNSIIEIGSTKPIIEEEDGQLSCYLPMDEEILNNSEIQIIFKTIKIGIESIIEVYDSYVELLEEEVQ